MEWIIFIPGNKKKVFAEAAKQKCVFPHTKMEAKKKNEQFPYILGLGSRDFGPFIFWMQFPRG